MSDMRRAATLFLEFKKVKGNQELSQPINAVEMLSRRNFNDLQEAIENMTSSEEKNGNPKNKLKSGLKIALLYLLKKIAKVVQGNYLIEGNDAKAEEVEKFVHVLNHNRDFVFGDAIYLLNKSRQVNLRKPDQLPLESDVKKLRDFTITKMKEMLDDNFLFWSPNEYVQLRDLAASRITLFNARRGGEPARLYSQNGKKQPMGLGWISNH